VIGLKTRHTPVQLSGVRLLRRRRKIPFPYAAQSPERNWQGTDEEENHIPNHTQPFQLVVSATHQECQAARVPISVGNRVPQLDYASGEQIQDDHEREANVCSPEAHSDELLRLLPRGIGLHGPQAEDHDCQGQHSKDTKHCGVGMIGGERRSHLKIRDDRQVDQETEDSRANEVPDAHRHEKIDGPLLVQGQFVTAGGTLRLSQLEVQLP